LACIKKRSWTIFFELEHVHEFVLEFVTAAICNNSKTKTESIYFELSKLRNPNFYRKDRPSAYIYVQPRLMS